MNKRWMVVLVAVVVCIVLSPVVLVVFGAALWLVRPVPSRVPPPALDAVPTAVPAADPAAPAAPPAEGRAPGG